MTMIDITGIRVGYFIQTLLEMTFTYVNLNQNQAKLINCEWSWYDDGTLTPKKNPKVN